MLVGNETASYTGRGTGRALIWYVIPAAGGKAVKINGLGNLQPLESQRPAGKLAEDGTVVFAAYTVSPGMSWRVSLESGTWTIRGSPQRVTAGSGELLGNASLDGRIPYATGQLLAYRYTGLSIDPKQGRYPAGCSPVYKTA